MAKHQPPKQPSGNGDTHGDGTAAWQKLTAQTRPLSAAQRDKGRGDKGAKSTIGKLAKSPKNPQKAGGLAASKPSSGAPGRPEKGAGAKPPPRPEIDHKQRRRLSRGRTDLDGTLDMHGMTLAEAEAALQAFIAYHRAQGHYWVLIITGKGVRGEGRLRKALPEWLARPPLSQAIAAYDQAAIPHGGGGAFYLRLRRPIARTR